MNRRTLVEFVTAWLLILLGVAISVLPIFDIMNVKVVFVIIVAVYGIVHLIKNFMLINAKDYSGFGISLSSVIALILMLFLDVNDSPWNLALILFIWVILMSLTKLKESDYYHDQKNKLWKLNIINLILFIITGLVTAVNLYYTGDIQILVLGFFLLINGMLELMDPLAAYLIEKK